MTGTIHEIEAQWPDLATKGYTVQPFLDEAELRALEQLYSETVPESSSPMSFSLFSSPLDARKAILAGFRKILNTKSAEIAPGFKIVSAIFVTKKAGQISGRLALHQDISLSGYNKPANISVWIPLCDVDLNNGCLLVAEGTQRFNMLSCAPPAAEPLVPFERDLAAPYVVGLPMKMGEGFIFDARLLHASEGNCGVHDRVAALFSLIPADDHIELSYRNAEDTNKIDAFHVEDDFMPEFNAFEYPDPAKRNRMTFVGSHYEPPRKLIMADFIQLHPAASGKLSSDKEPDSAWRAVETKAASPVPAAAVYQMPEVRVAPSSSQSSLIKRLWRLMRLHK